MLQFLAVEISPRGKFAIVMGMHLLWGLVLWFSISKYGLGISTDSVQLLFGAKNLVAGNGLVSYDGSFLNLWPPLYPALLALVHLITGTSALTSATILQAAAYVGTSICLSALFLETFRGDLLLALAASALVDIGAVILTTFDVVGSDYLEFFLIVLAILLAARYINEEKPGIYVALAAVGMLAMLDRYLGAAVIVSSAVSVAWKTGTKPAEKLWRGLFLCLGAAPALTWLGVTARLSQARGPITFAENFSWFSKSILEWFLPTKTVKAELAILTVALWVIIAGIGGALAIAWWSYRRRASGEQPEERPPVEGSYLLPNLTFGAVYVLMLFGAAAVTYFNKLGGRFLLPLYVPFITLLVTAVAVLVQRSRSVPSVGWRLGGPVVGAAALVVTAALLLQVTAPLIPASHTDGATGGDNVYNTRQWNKNQAIAYWRANAPRGTYRLYSDEPDALAFFTGEPVLSSPRSKSGPYASETYALDSFPAEIFVGSEEAYLIWIEPSPEPYFYTVEQLATAMNVQPLFEGEDGGVYRLSQKAGN